MVVVKALPLLKVLSALKWKCHQDAALAITGELIARALNQYKDVILPV